MKKTLSFLFIVICVVALFPHTSRAQELPPRPIVRLIYFYPRDRAPQPNIDEKIDKLIKDTQEFYAQQMENHGFGRKTFVFETDAQGKAVVHHIKGRLTHTSYQNDYNEAWSEAMERFDRSNHTLFTVLDVDLESCARGDGNGRTGIAFVTTGEWCFSTFVAAHELGHAFGLNHDYRAEGNWIPALGVNEPMITSFCAAEWLDAIPAFNANSTLVNTDTGVEMLAPSLVIPSNMLRLRFKVTDPDGIHQVQWFTYEPFRTEEYPALWDYKGLKGVPSHTVEFVTTRVKPKNKQVILKIIDRHGNITRNEFPIDITQLLLPPEVVSIPDANLAAAVQQEIGNITTHTMRNLRILHASDRQITELTGLEHAVNLQSLFLSNIGITDVAPLAALTQLVLLGLDGNNISDVSPLAALTQLKTLYLHHNSISDVSPLVGLDLFGGLWDTFGLYIVDNPLNYASIHTHIPAMQARGIEIEFDERAYPALDIISGAGQQVAGGVGLAAPFVVAAIDARGTPMQGVSVNFTVIEGSGELSTTNVTTDARGRAQTTLTLGPTPGINRVQATAAALQSSVPFIAITAEAPALITENVEAPQHIAEDVNGDGIVNVQDLVLVSSRLGQTGQNAADVNGDEVINVQDLVLVAAALGEEGRAAAPTLHPKDLEGLPAADVQRLLTQARQLARTDPAYLGSVAVLEQLLAFLLPKETTLLPNYPNPFNPETWIPYQLSKPTEVTLHIYAVNGALVRTLALGHQSAGMYHSKSRAAYWDGRNALGERVASGPYFYTFTAGDFTATRKLLIRK